MRSAWAVAGIAAVVVVAGGVLQHTIGQPRPAPAAAKDLRPVASFAQMSDERARSIALFEEAGKVLLHPRCVNCHPAGDRPLQNTNMQPHEPLVVRGPDGFGATGMRCTTCHGAENYDPAGVPGHPRWHLAPIEMAWEGRTLGAICEQVKDPKRNGGKSMAELVEHMESDSLVGWGWSPGAGRERVPGTQQVFGELIRAWADSGAVCPSP
jgi:hypothetical protein